MPGVHGAHHNPNPPPMPVEYMNPSGTNPPASSLIDITTPKQAFDPVEKPQHYNRGGVECRKALQAACVGLDGWEGTCTSNAIKFMWRWKFKGKPIQDIKKAIEFMNYLIEYLEENEVADQ